MAGSTTTHYVSRIVVERVEKSETPIAGSHNHNRTSVTVANVVVSSPSLKDLLDKTSKHLELIEDGGEIEGRKTR